MNMKSRIHYKFQQMRSNFVQFKNSGLILNQHHVNKQINNNLKN